MRALMKNLDLPKRATCWIVAFTLVFSLFGTPAYAAEAAEAPEAEAVPAVVEPTVAPAEEPAAPALPAYSADTAADQVNAAGTEDETSTTDETSTNNKVEGTEEGTEEGSTEETTDPTEPTDPDPDDPYATTLDLDMTLDATFDSETRAITYDLSLTNNTDTAYEGIALECLMWYKSENVELDVPETIDLAPGESVAYTFTVELNFAPEDHGTIQAAFQITATLDDKQAWGSRSDMCQIPIEAYEVAYNAVLLDADGNELPKDCFAGPGDIVRYSYTFTNTGNTSLQSITALPVSSSFVPTNNWQATNLAVGQSATFTGDYKVTDADVLGTSYGLIDGKINVSVNGGESQELKYESVKVDMPRKYTLNYYLDDITQGNFLGSYESDDIYPHGETYQIPSEDLNEFLPEGYLPYEMAPVELSYNAEENVFDVVYKAEEIPYTINYYFDYIDDEPFETITGQGLYGDPIEVDADLYWEEGYLPAQVSGPSFIGLNAEDNVVNVLYERASFGYTINYYKDSIDQANLLGSDTGEGLCFDGIPYELGKYLPEGYNASGEVIGATNVGHIEDENVLNVVYSKQENIPYTINYYLDSLDGQQVGTDTRTGTFGDVPTFDESLYLPFGYTLPAQVSGIETIGANPEANVINVVYQRGNYGYTINYYTDTISEDTYLRSVEGTAEFGSLIPFDLGAYAPEGYDPNGVINGVTVVGYDEAQNVLNIVYQKQTSLEYTINYYLDSTDGQLVGTESGFGTFGDVIEVDEDAYIRPGYTLPAQVSGAETITAHSADNVVNVVYPRGTYAYTVNYYTDSISADNLITSETGTRIYEEAIPYTMGAHVPFGYDPNGAAYGATTVSYNANTNVLNIVYQKQTNIPYTINYYLGTEFGQPVATETGTGTFGDAIPVDVDAYIEPGYLSGQVVGATTISVDPNSNVMSVIYPRGTFDYTVNYYTDSVDPANLVGSEPGTGTYLDPISYTMGAYAPEGYNTTGVISGATTVGYDATNNVLNIVYSKQTGLSYTINYYLGSTDGQLVGTETGTGTFGDAITVDQGAYLQPGFSASAQVSGATTIGANTANNVVNVVYAPTFEDFYAVDIAPVNATYDGSVHYIQPEGVVAGDVITYTYNGTTVTRTVGVDENIGLGFQEVTDGDVAVSVTVTRAGIVSDPMQTSVNIAAAVVVPPTPEEPSEPTDPVNPPTDPITPTDPVTPVDPETPTQPETPVQPDVPAYPVDPSTPGVDTPGNVTDVIAGLLGEGAAAPAYQAESPADAPEATADDPAEDPASEETTIEDDVNPLASSPFSTESPAQQTNAFGYVLLFLAVLCAAAAVIMLVVRKRWINTNVPTLDGATLAAEKVKTSKLSLYAAILFAAALSSGVLWFIFRI